MPFILFLLDVNVFIQWHHKIEYLIIWMPEKFWSLYGEKWMWQDVRWGDVGVI